MADETNPGWGTVWIELWHRDQENPNPTQALEDQGREWLNSILDGELKGGHNDWGYVWKEIANYAPEDEEHWLLGGKWLEVVDETNSGWGRVWLELWRRDKKKPNTTTILGDQGREWLNSILDGELKGGHNGWRYVWKELANYYPKDEEYWSLGGKWLEVVVETNSEWGTVWIDLWHRDRENPNPSQALERRGREWLNSILEGELNGGHNGWGFVWKVLAEQCPDDQNHLARGGEWLEAVDNENKGWSWVWGVLWYKYRNNEQIAERMTIDGQRWLKHILDQQLEIKSNDWGYVWKVLASHNSRDSTHLELGKDWLEWVRKDDSGWSVVFEWFVDKGNQPASFIQKGYVWCNPEELSDNLGFVFEKIIKELLNRDKVPAAEIQILNNGPVSSTRWVYIWKAYWSSGKRSEKLAKMGKEWLGRNDALSREVWASIWKIMWVHFRNDDDYLAGIVTVWLEQEEVKWRALPSILINLSKNPKYMSSLWKFGVPCLVHIGVSHNKWAKLWLRVWDALLPNLSGRTELVEQGIGWLETYGARGPERLSGGEWSEMWCRIWKRLWCTGEKQAELKGVAEEHLSGQYPYRNSLIEMALKGSDICSA